MKSARRTELQTWIVAAMQAHRPDGPDGATTQQVRDSIWLSFGKRQSLRQVAQGMRKLVAKGEMVRETRVCGGVRILQALS